MSEPILLLVITMDSQNPGQRGHRRNRGSLSTDSKSTTSQCLQVRLIKKESWCTIGKVGCSCDCRVEGSRRRGAVTSRTLLSQIFVYDRSPAGFHMMLLKVAASSD